jgi:hypothetical protein
VQRQFSVEPRDMSSMKYLLHAIEYLVGKGISDFMCGIFEFCILLMSE